MIIIYLLRYPRDGGFKLKLKTKFPFVRDADNRERFVIFYHLTVV
jgi:hypothetical protein